MISCGGRDIGGSGPCTGRHALTGRSRGQHRLRQNSRDGSRRFRFSHVSLIGSSRFQRVRGPRGGGFDSSLDRAGQEDFVRVEERPLLGAEPPLAIDIPATGKHCSN